MGAGLRRGPGHRVRASVDGPRAGMIRRSSAVAGVLAAVSLVGPAASAPDVVGFDPTEVRRILQHGPWAPPLSRDPSNRSSGNPEAIALGSRLFFDPRLSSNGAIACASCHVPERAWTDGRSRAVGLERLDRNTPTILDTARHRWFSWDGRSDSLWSQSVKPILDPREMGASALHVARLVRGDAEIGCLYAKTYREPALDDERVLVNVGKALAAFLETVGSGRAPFDEFRDA